MVSSSGTSGPHLVVHLDVALVGQALAVPVEVVEGARLLGGQPEEPEVPVLRDELVPVLHHVVPGAQADLLAQPVGVGHLELDARDDAQHPDRDLRGVQQVVVVRADVAHLARGGHEPHPADRPRQARVAGARAVRPGRDGSGDLLRVDVALVAQRQAGLPERLVEVADPGAGERRRAPVHRVRVHHPGQRRQVEQQPVGLHDGGERVAGSRHADATPRSAACLTSAATSSSSRGAAIEDGVKDWLPTQFCQVGALCAIGPPAGRRPSGPP